MATPFFASPCEIRMTTYTTETIDALNPKLLRVAGATSTGTMPPPGGAISS